MFLFAKYVLFFNILQGPPPPKITKEGDMTITNHLPKPYTVVRITEKVNAVMLLVHTASSYNHATRCFLADFNYNGNCHRSVGMQRPSQNKVIHNLQRAKQLSREETYAFLQVTRSSEFSHFTEAEPMDKIELTGSAFVKILNFIAGKQFDEKFAELIKAKMNLDSGFYPSSSSVMYGGSGTIEYHHPIETYNGFYVSILMSIDTLSTKGVITHLYYTKENLGCMKIDPNALKLMHNDIGKITTFIDSMNQQVHATAVSNPEGSSAAKSSLSMSSCNRLPSLSAPTPCYDDTSSQHLPPYSPSQSTISDLPRTPRLEHAVIEAAAAFNASNVADNASQSCKYSIEGCNDNNQYNTQNAETSNRRDSSHHAHSISSSSEETDDSVEEGQISGTKRKHDYKKDNGKLSQVVGPVSRPEEGKNTSRVNSNEHNKKKSEKQHFRH